MADLYTSRNFARGDALMTEDLPRQRDEGKLLQEFMDADERSIRELAKMAGMSDTRWRQIVKGHMTTGGHVTEVVAPANTLARMAYVIGISPELLSEAGRNDAAALLYKMRQDLELGISAAPLPATGASSGGVSEIDMIYASTTMTAREKLSAIRIVLQLEAQAAEEEAAAEAPVRPNPSA